MLFCEEKQSLFPLIIFFSVWIEKKACARQRVNRREVEILLEKQCFDGFALPFLNSTTCLMGKKTKMEKTS